MTVGDNLEEFYGKVVEDFDLDKGIEKPTGVVYRLRCEYDDEVTTPDRIQKFAEDPKAKEVKALVIGVWDFEGGDSSEVVEALMKHKTVFQGLEALMIGDITGEENEISWIEQCDLGPLINALPNLVHFQCRGGTGLELKGIKSSKLKTLIVESGGLPNEVIRDVMKAEVPNLEHLELWLGTEDYGFQANIHDLRPLLSGKNWPKLKHLGLRDSTIADAIAKSFTAAEKADVSSVQVEGKTFVLTGKLLQLDRKKAEAALEAQGAKIGGSVSKTTDYLVAGEKAGSKMEKAKSLGVPVLSEGDLMVLIGGDTSNVSDAGGSVLDTIKVLDLSMGTLSDDGAKALLANPKIRALEKLDLHYHYMSDEMMEALRALPIQVDVSDQQDFEEDPEDRYVAVSE